MTAVTEAPATLAATAVWPTQAEWYSALDNLSSELWVGRERTSTWLFEQSPLLGSLEGLAPSVVAHHYRQGAYPDMPRDAASEQTLLSWLEDTVSPDPSPEDAAAAALPNPLTNQTLEQQIAQAITAAGPSVWDGLGRSFSEEVRERWHAEIVEVIAYQVNNWKRGKQIRPNDQARLQQFTRRYTKTTNTSVRYELEAMILTVLSYMNKVAVLGQEDARVVPIMPDSASIRVFIEANHPELNITGLETRTHSYVADTLRHVVMNVIRSGTYSEFEELDPESETWKSRLRDYSYDVGSESTVEQRVTMYEIARRYVLPDADEKNYEPIEGMDSPEKVFAWLLNLHPGISAFRVSALTNGWADFVDQWKEHGEFKNDKDLVFALRRCVRQYGYAKFTGRAPKSVLMAALEDCLKGIKGVGLSVEEWKARWARRDIAVSYVSGRYGEVHGLCSVLEAATAELGIDPLRKPQVPVNFQGGGVEVVVMVETWKDDEQALRSAAKTKWGQMTAPQRMAAVIKQENIHINWNEMVSQ